MIQPQTRFVLRWEAVTFLILKIGDWALTGYGILFLGLSEGNKGVLNAVDLLGLPGFILLYLVIMALVFRSLNTKLGGSLGKLYWVIVIPFLLLLLYPIIHNIYVLYTIQTLTG